MLVEATCQVIQSPTNRQIPSNRLRKLIQTLNLPLNPISHLYFRIACASHDVTKDRLAAHQPILPIGLSIPLHLRLLLRRRIRSSYHAPSDTTSANADSSGCHAHCDSHPRRSHRAAAAFRSRTAQTCWAQARSSQDPTLQPIRHLYIQVVAELRVVAIRNHAALFRQLFHLPHISHTRLLDAGAPSCRDAAPSATPHLPPPLPPASVSRPASPDSG